MKPVLAVHGGAWNIPDALWPAHRDGCRAAHDAGMAVLAGDGSALEAVVAAIRVMEDDPVFDAGFGSFLNEEGRIELDAGLMAGANLASGAVLGVNRVRNPIDLALYVLRETPHCLFQAEGAHRLAERAGLPMVAPDYHVHERERAIFDRIRAGDRQILDGAWTSLPGDTVGAVAMDRRGHLAAGNSTGGTRDKAVGRVGDAALIGSGFYADDELGAVVCTGWGESIMRSAMAMYALGVLPDQGPAAAARAAVDHMHHRTGGFAGLLVLSPNGRIGVAFNTPRMAFHAPAPRAAPGPA